jgi:hypothetical protein
MIWFLGIILLTILVFLFGGGYVVKLVETEDTDRVHKEKMERFRGKHLWKIELAVKLANWSLVVFILYCILSGIYIGREG